MHKPCVIVIEYDTREHLKELAKKSQTYDKIINELISLKEDKNSVSRGQTDQQDRTYHIQSSEVPKYG